MFTLRRWSMLRSWVPDDPDGDPTGTRYLHYRFVKRSKEVGPQGQVIEKEVRTTAVREITRL